MKTNVNKCNWDYLDGLYVADGYSRCAIRKKDRRASFVIGIQMRDREALEKVAPCFGTKIMTLMHKGRPLYRIEKTGKEAKRILDRLPRTKTRRMKDEKRLEECKKKWKEGYTE